MIVSDATLLVHLVSQAAETPAAERVSTRDPEWMAPPLWQSEVRSALLKYVRAGVLGVEAAAEQVADLKQLVRTVPVESADVLRAAFRYGLSAYDAEYVVLARALGVRLVTSDKRVLAAVPDVAVSPEAFADAAR